MCKNLSDAMTAWNKDSILGISKKFLSHFKNFIYLKKFICFFIIYFFKLKDNWFIILG